MRGDIDTRFRHLEGKIGLFVFVALLGCLAVVLFIGAESDLFTPKFRLRFTVPKGTGFAKGMPVKLSGFRIGRIEAISLNEEAKVDVILQIDKQYQKWIRQDSIAKLDKEGLVGDAIIELSAGSAARPMLEDGAVIAFEKTRSIDEHVAELADKIKPILIDLHELVSYLNSPDGDVKRSLANIEAFTRDLQTTRSKAERLLEHTTADFDGVAKTINGAVGHADRSLTTLDGSLQHLEQVMKKVDAQVPVLLRRLDQTLSNAEGLSADLRKASRDAAPQISPLVERIDKVVRDTGSLVNEAQDIWLLRSDLPVQTAPPLLRGDSHE